MLFTYHGAIFVDNNAKLMCAHDCPRRDKKKCSKMTVHMVHMEFLAPKKESKRNDRPKIRIFFSAMKSYYLRTKYSYETTTAVPYIGRFARG